MKYPYDDVEEVVETVDVFVVVKVNDTVVLEVVLVVVIVLVVLVDLAVDF